MQTLKFKIITRINNNKRNKLFLGRNISLLDKGIAD